MLTCQEVIDYLSAYIAGELPPEERAAMEQHLALCPACVSFLETFRTALALAQSPHLFPTEAELPEGVVKAVLAARRQAP